MLLWGKRRYRFDDVSGLWVSRAKVSEVPFTDFASKKIFIHAIYGKVRDGQDGRLLTKRLHATRR